MHDYFGTDPLRLKCPKCGTQWSLFDLPAECPTCGVLVDIKVVKVKR